MKIKNKARVDYDSGFIFEYGNLFFQKQLLKLRRPEILLHDFEGGKYAVYHFKGIPQLLFMVYQEIFCRWLSKTGNELDERPIIDIYRKIEEDGYMEIDICFPLKTKLS